MGLGSEIRDLDPEKTSVADPVLQIRIRDLGSGTFLTPGSGDPGWVKNQDPDPGTRIRELRNNFLG
jgi:hypothetical protein